MPAEEPPSPHGAERPSTGPIYVGGLDRSGKTTLSAYLTSHSRIAIPGVGSNLWTYFYRQYGDLAEPRNLERCLAALLAYKHVRYLEPDPARIRAEFWQGPPTYARLFELLLLHFAERKGKPRWGAQTGLIERYGDEVIEAYEGVRIVHMLRDPRDRYVASLELWPKGRGRAGGATARWLYSTRLAERHAARYPNQYLIVRFEDLINQSESTLRTVCGFLGEAFEPAMLEMGGAPKHRKRLAPISSPEQAAVELSADHIGRFRGRVSAAEIGFIQLHAGRHMRRYGYELDRLQRSPWGHVRFPLIDWPNQAARWLAWRGAEELQQRFPGHVGRKPGRRMIVEAG